MHPTQFYTRVPLKTCALEKRWVQRRDSNRNILKKTEEIKRMEPKKAPAVHQFARAYKRLFQGVCGRLSWTQLNRVLTRKPAKKVKGKLPPKPRTYLPEPNPSSPGMSYRGHDHANPNRLSRKKRIAVRREARATVKH